MNRAAGPSWPPAQRRGGLCRRVAIGAAVGAGAILAATAASAQQTGVRLTTGVDLSESVVDVAGRLNGTNGTEAVTRVSPSLRIVGRGGRVQGSLAYSLSAIYRAGREESSGREFQNTLDGSLLGEVVPGWAYVDARASISQQSISAFGRPSDDGSGFNRNRTEVSSLTVSPYVRGEIAGSTRYEARLTGALSNSRSSTAADSKYAVAALTLGSARPSRLGWDLLASTQRVSFSNASRPIDTDRVLATITTRPDLDLALSVNGGVERTDFGGPFKREFENYGVSLRWTPSPRTLVQLGADERYFGRSYRVILNHRTPRTIFTYSDVRDVNDSGGVLGVGQPVTLYQLLFQQFASQQPDPVLRDLLVQQRLRELGRSADERLYVASLFSSQVVQHRQDFSAVWSAPRTTVSLQASRSQARQVADSAAIFALVTPDVTQSGYGLNVSHKLTPTAAVGLDGARQTTRGSGSQPGTNSKSAGISLTDRLGPRASAGLRAGYRVFNSVSDPSRETTVSASLALQF